MATKFYELAKLFCENAWEGMTDIPEILDYNCNGQVCDDDYIFNNFLLYRSDFLQSNILLQLEEHRDKDDVYYVVKFYKTRKNNLNILKKSYITSYLDKIISMKIYANKVDLIYSEHLYTPEIVQICDEVYNFVSSYIYTKRGLNKDKLKEESDKLTKL